MCGVIRSALRISKTRRHSAADLQRPTTRSRFHATMPAMPFPFDATLKEILAFHPEDCAAAFGLTGLRVKKEDLASIYQGVRVMHESTAYDMAVEEGCVKTSHRVLLKQGRRLLGLPQPSVEAALTSIQDVERLERMAEAILTVKSWEELLSTS